MTAAGILRIAAVLILTVPVSACWIPLPEETAIVVEVLDPRGGPVDGIRFDLDGTETLTTGDQVNPGQIFKSLSGPGLHTLQMEVGTLLDPQGGVGWIPLASRISGEILPLSFGQRPFSGGSDVLPVPVNKGEITVVTIFLEDFLESPADNQWLTDGSDPFSPYRVQDGDDEFQDSPEPVFWWRQDPSLGATVTHTLQFWEDDDGDTRYPLGIMDQAGYTADMGIIEPDWQVPLAGIQRAEAASTPNQVVVWSSQASDGSDIIKYDLYYAPESQWNNGDWERNPVLRGIASSFDGTAVKFAVGTGTPNSSVILKNGIQYTFGLRARDSDSNLDATVMTSTRTAIPPSSGTPGAVTGLSAAADSTLGGRIELSFGCTAGEDLRIYAAPSPDFNIWPFDVRFLREMHVCIGGTDTFTISGLVNGVSYAVGVEPFDASGNVGTATFVLATPSGSSATDTTPPSLPSIAVSSPGPGQVSISVPAVSDSESSVFRRVYWSPVVFTSNQESMLFTDLAASPAAVVDLSDIPNGIEYNYGVRAIDAFGNSSFAATRYTLTVPDASGPAWASDDPVFFTTVSYSTAGTVWPLGLTWKYNGFALGVLPPGRGEYVWRVIQENPERPVALYGKLGAFYTWSGYFYVSTESGGLSLGPSSDVSHRDVLNFVEEGIASADVIGAPFDSGASGGYRQRTAALFAGAMASGSDTTNQISILYNTDEDGQTVVFPATGGGYLGILKVLAVNKQRPFPTPEPYLQTKEFWISYYSEDDGLVAQPPPFSGGTGIYFVPPLDQADYSDPIW